MKPQRGRRAVLTALMITIAAGIAGCSDQQITAPKAVPISTATPDVSTGQADVAEALTAETLAAGSLAANTGDTSPVVEPIVTEAIPGLDSDNSFCAAWSRFAGSFQIITPAWLVAGDPGSDVNPSELEASAAQTMVAAYYDMSVSWPDSIIDAKDRSLATYQPMFQRMGRALDYLKAAGATDEQLVEIAAWWQGQLATFDGFTFPTIDGAPALLRPVIQTAGELVAENEVPIPEDPNLVTASEPLVEMFDYLAGNCPDQGLLSGREVGDAQS